MKVTDLIDKIEAWGNNRWILCCVWLAYTLLVVALCSIHEPWEDESHVWNMVSTLSFSELWEAMRVEGHFCIWHLCVWPWVRILGMDYHALFVASTILMSGAVWLLLFKLDFTFIGKLLIVFSAPVFYYFPVISRCYALIPPILIAIAIVYQKQKNPFLYCFLIGCLAHTHVFMEGMVGVLWCLFIYDNVYIPYKNNEKQHAKRNLWASLITVVLVLVAFIQVMGGIADAAEGTSVAFNSGNHPTDWLLFVYKKHHMQLTMSLNQLISNYIPKIDLPVTLILYVTITILLYKLIHQSKRKVANVWILSVSIVWQILFAVNIYCMQYQRVYLLFLPIFYILWIEYTIVDKKSRQYIMYIILCFWLLNTPSQYEIIKDIKGVYCYDVSAAQQVKSHITESERPIIVYQSNCGMFFDKKVKEIADIAKLDSILSHDYADQTDFYVISPVPIDSTISRSHSVECLCEATEGTNDFADVGRKKRFITLYAISKNN